MRIDFMMRKVLKKLQNKSGVALLLALSSTAIIAILAADLVYEVELYNRIVYNDIDQLRAKHIVKSSLKIALLRIVAAKRANDKIKSFGKNSPVSQSEVDAIWSAPFILPPPLLPNSSLIAKEAHKNFISELGLNSSMSIQIEGSSGKINLNRMIWTISRSRDQVKNPKTPPPPPTPSPAPPIPPTPPLTNEEYLNNIREKIMDIADKIIEDKKIDDEEFKLKYENITGRILIKNILSWIDIETTLDGDEIQKDIYYSGLPEPYSVKNAPLYSISELIMVKGFDDELVKIFSDNFTATITEGININAVELDLIKVIFPSIAENPNLLEKFQERITEGFENVSDFWAYMKSEMEFTDENKKNITDAGIQIVTKETAFRVFLDVTSGSAQKSWIAYVGGAPPSLDANNKSSNAASQKLPNIVYLRTD